MVYSLQLGCLELQLSWELWSAGSCLPAALVIYLTTGTEASYPYPYSQSSLSSAVQACLYKDPPVRYVLNAALQEKALSALRCSILNIRALLLSLNSLLL